MNRIEVAAVALMLSVAILVATSVHKQPITPTNRPPVSWLPRRVAQPLHQESRVVIRGHEYDITKLDDTKLHSLRAELLEESDSCGPTQDTGNPSALLDCLKIAKEFKRRREAAGESTQERVDSTRQMVQKLQEQVQALTLEVEKLRDRTQSLVGRVPDKPPTVESEHGTFVLTDVLRAALCARPSDEEMEAIMRGTHVHGVPDLSEYQDSERRGQDDGK